jgi:hypothetical protein
MCFDITFKALKQQKTMTVLSSLVTHTQQCIKRLTYSFPYHDLLLTVGEIQCACLDIQGLSTYITKFWPRTIPTSLEELKVLHRINTSLMGCFTHSRDEAQFLHSIGIPVWWIRPNFIVNQFDTRVYTSTRRAGTFIDPGVVKEEYIEAGSGKKVFEDVYVGLPGTSMQQSTLQLECCVFNVTKASAIAYQKLEQKYCTNSSGIGSGIAPQPGMISSVLRV